MRQSSTVEKYLARIRMELYGLDAGTARSILQELGDHIEDKSMDIAKGLGLEGPDEKVYKQVVEGLGPPDEVVVDYLKGLPKRPTRGLKFFILLQGAIALASILVGLDQLAFSREITTMPSYDTSYLVSMTLIGVLFLLLGAFVLVTLSWQARRPHTVVQYGTVSSVLSLALAAGLLLVMSRSILWRYSDEGVSEGTVYGIATPAFLLIVYAYILGLGHSADFQRRFTLEELDTGMAHQARRRSNVTTAIVMVVSLILLSSTGISMYHYDAEITRKDVLVSTEAINGSNDAVLEHWKAFYDGQWYDNYKILYTSNGERKEGVYFPAMRSALEWIRDSTSLNSIVLCWWDYGHSIQGFTGRGSVLLGPSRSIEDTIADPSSIGDWEDEARVKKVAEALVATDINVTIGIMEDLGAEYLLTNRRDTTDISYAFFRAAGLDTTDYLKWSAGGAFSDPTALGRLTLIYRIWAGETVPGLELEYSDIDMRILRIVPP